MQTCVVCEKQATNVCSACEAQAYCGESCQRVDWEDGHSEECQTVDSFWRYRMKSIVDIVVKKRDFSTLETALREAGLVAALSGRGPFTVFAPTNAAFAKIPQDQLDDLLADRAALTDVLLYHVADGKVKARDLIRNGSGVLPMKNNKSLDYRVSGGQVLLSNGSSFVTKADIRASNGIIHVVSDVLMPPM